MFNADGEEAPAKKAQKTNFSYEEVVEKQKAEGGPRRFYGDDELDIESARVTDENGNPVIKSGNKHDQQDEIARHYAHVNVQYCIS